MPSAFTTDLTQYQVVVKRTWSDGSVKHAIVSGRAALTQNAGRTVNVSAGGTPPAGTALTADSIRNAAPTASVSCGTFGTVSLSNLLTTPIRTWVSGPEMVECHYRADVGGGTLLSVWFHVRLFADGKMWVRAVVENGYLDNGAGAVAANADRSYVPTVAIGGTNVYTNGGSALSHYKYTRWSVEGWIGGDPQVTALHDVAYLNATKLVPNYGWRSPSETALSAWAQSYTPMMRGDIIERMSSPGFQEHIGLLPLWDALYTTSGDARALRSTLANSSAVNSRPIVFRSKTANLIPRPSDFPTWTYDGPGTGGPGEPFAGGLSFEVAHAMNAGYLPYLLTGDYWHYETLAMCSSFMFFNLTQARGAGVNRKFEQGQTRGVAWMKRTVGCYAALAPADDTVAADYRLWLEKGGYEYWAGIGPNNANAKQIGYLVNFGSNVSGPLTTQPWMHHFWIATNGFLWDIEPGFANTASHLAVRNFMYKAAVGILGPNGTSSYCFTEASLYDGLIISPTTFPNAGQTIYCEQFYDNWGQVFQATKGAANASCGNTLGGGSGGAPGGASGGYWGNLLPAIAYAVDHAAAGARDSWTRLTGASNWSTLANSGFDDKPLWGITPRS